MSSKNRIPAGLKSTPEKRSMSAYNEKYERSLRSRSFSIQGNSVDEKRQQIDSLERLAIECGFPGVGNNSANISGFINWLASHAEIVDRYGRRELVAKVE